MTPAKPKKKPKPPTVFATIEPHTCILSIDASTTSTGLALVETIAKPPWLRIIRLDLVTAKGSDRFARIDEMTDRVEAVVSSLAADYSLELVLMEWATGAGFRAHGGSTQVVGPLAFCQGSIRRAIRPHVGRIETYTSQEWGRGTSKQNRRDWSFETFFSYASVAKKDKGFDISDAICLANWRIKKSP